MSFAQEVRDFTSAFTAVSSVLGTRESREADRLNNEYRRAQIDYTRALTADKMGEGQDLDDYLTGTTYDPAPISTSPDITTPATAGTDVAAKSDRLRSGWLTETGLGVPARTGAGAGVVVPTPTSPARTGTGAVVPTPPARTAAVDDSDILAPPRTEAVSGTNIGAAGVKPDYQVAIRDRTSMRGVQPKTYNILNHANAAAKQMGIRLVVTAGAGGGHRSHGQGTELDLIGYHADGSKWTTAERAKVALAGGRVGANRFGLYPGMSLHIGTAGAGRPSAMWGAGGRVSGDSSRQFTDPADRAFYQAFQNGKIFGNSGPASFDASMASSNYRSPLERARNAIRFMESSGDYSTNTGNGALGAYQVMAKNLPSWSREAFGREVSSKEFLASPELQDRLFDYKFGQYFQKYGNLQDAASSWFTGQPLARGADRSDGNITGAQYVARFNKNLGLPETGTTTGGAGAGGARGAAVPDIEYDTFAKDDEIAPPYPEETAPEPNPMASSTDATMMDTGTGSATEPTGGMVPTGDRVHTVEEGDTLWDLAEKYNLETYMRLVKANPQIANPDLIYPGERFKVPGAAVPDEDSDIPLPRSRPGTRTKDDEATLESGSEPDIFDTNRRESEDIPLPGTPVEGDPTVPLPPSGAVEEADVPLPRPRPAGGGAVDEAEVPLPRPRPGTRDTSGSPEEALAAAVTARQNVEASDEEPAVKSALLRALDVKIEQLKLEVAKMRSGAAAEPGSESGASDRGLNEAGMTPPAPERGPVDRDKLSGMDSSDTMAGGRGVDDLGPAQTSIAEVTNSWNITDDGHVITPEGQKVPNNSFKSGRNAARAGSNWLARNFFPGPDNDAVDLAENAAPDDGSDTAADRYLSGAYAVKKSDMAKIHDVVDAWAAKHGVELTESERNMRSLGIMFDYWLTRGEPEKAEAVAGAMLQYYRVRYGQYSAIAKAALSNGDTEKAVEAAVKAYAQIPDGRDITVEGDAENGWTFSYVNEETGKRISQKVMSPQEVQGMIMGMEPGDVDKFLVKAAGADELPEPSAAFSAALDALNATPPGEKPVYDANAMAYFDSGEASIYGNAFAQKMDEWQQGAAMRDYEKVAGVPPPTSVATPPTGGAAVTPPTGGAAVTPPTGGAAATPPATGGAGREPLPGGARQIAPKVYTPGDDGTFGLGDFEQLNLVPTETTFGIEWQKLNYENRKEVYEREKARRDHSYQRWVYANEMLAPPEMEDSPLAQGPGAGLSAVPVPAPEPEAYGPPSEAAIPGAAAFGPRADRLAATALPTVKGPRENWGLVKRPEADENILAVLKDDALRAAYETKVGKRQAAWDASKDLIQAQYLQQTEVPEPVNWSVEEEQGAEEAFTGFPEGFDLTEDEVANGIGEEMTAFVKNNKEGLTQLAIRIGQQNEGMTPQSAATAVLGLTVPDPERLGVPPFVAVPHPENANLFIVQPLDVDDSMDGMPLLMRRAEVDLVIDYWNNERMRIVAARNVGVGMGGNTLPPPSPGAGLSGVPVPPTGPGVSGPVVPAGALEIEGTIPEGGAAPGLAPMERPIITNPQPAALNDPNRIPGTQYTPEQLEQMSTDPAIIEWNRRRELEKARTTANQPGAGALDLFDPYADVPGYPSPIYNR